MEGEMISVERVRRCPTPVQTTYNIPVRLLSIRRLTSGQETRAKPRASYYYAGSHRQDLYSIPLCTRSAHFNESVDVTLIVVRGKRNANTPAARTTHNVVTAKPIYGCLDEVTRGGE